MPVLNSSMTTAKTKAASKPRLSGVGKLKSVFKLAMASVSPRAKGEIIVSPRFIVPGSEIELVAQLTANRPVTICSIKWSIFAEEPFGSSLTHGWNRPIEFTKVCSDRRVLGRDETTFFSADFTLPPLGRLPESAEWFAQFEGFENSELVMDTKSHFRLKAA